MKKNSLCPCSSGKSYQTCCQPLHEGLPAPTPLALMRSRYSAYALGLVDYVIRTKHPFDASQRKEIEQFCQETAFDGLEIFEVKEGDETGTVAFRAHLSRDGKDCSFTEKSLFEKVNGKWLYLSGIIEPSSTT